MGDIDDIADRYVDAYAQLDPIMATSLGIDGHDDRMTDLTPEGFAARADLERRTLAQLEVVEPVDERERVAREAMQERLGSALDLYDAGLLTSEVNVIAGPLHHLRGVFDLMPLAGEAAAKTVHSRLSAVPTALTQLRQTLTEAAAHGHIVAQRQLVEVATQCDTWVDPAQDDFWPGLVRRTTAAADLPSGLVADLEHAANAARTATADFGQFLRDELAPQGSLTEAAGPERYALYSRQFLGATVDLPETYAWGLAELARIEAEMRAVAELIQPGATPAEAIDLLDHDPARRVDGREEFRGWMQDLADRTVAELNGTHFDIPEQVRRSSAASLRSPTAASTTPVRPRTSAGPAGCGGRYRPEWTHSSPGRKPPSSTTRACPGITCRSGRPRSGPTS